MRLASLAPSANGAYGAYILYPTSVNKLTLGEAIRFARKEVSMSLRSLANQCDISPTFLSDIELDRRMPSEELLELIAIQLGKPEEYFEPWDDRHLVSKFKRRLASSYFAQAMGPLLHSCPDLDLLAFEKAYSDYAREKPQREGECDILVVENSHGVLDMRHPLNMHPDSKAKFRRRIVEIPEGYEIEVMPIEEYEKRNKLVSTKPHVEQEEA